MTANNSQAQGLTRATDAQTTSCAAVLPVLPMQTRDNAARCDTMPTASQTASLAFPRFFLTFAGKKWRIFKRAGSPCWYLVFQKDGKRHLHSLGDTTKETACEAAKLKIRAWKEGRLDVLRRSMERPAGKQFSSMTEFCAAALASPCGKLSSREDQVAKLRRVIQRAGRNPDTCTTVVFSDDTAKDYFRHVEQHAQTITNQKRRNSYIGSALATFTGSMATIAPAKLRHYENLTLPDVTSWREALKKSGVKHNKARGFDAPPLPMVRAMMREWVRIAQDGDYAHVPHRFEFDRRNVFLAMGLMLSFGLRKSEVAQVRWEWFTRDNYGPVLRGDALVKNGSGELRMTPLNPFWRIFNHFATVRGWRKASGPVLDGTCSADVRDYPFTHIGLILRRLGWETQKTNHALRDLAASLITTKFGANKAQWWARHSSVTTTEAHYSRFVDQRAALTQANVLPWLNFATE